MPTRLQCDNWLDEAARGGYGVGAFNVNNMEAESSPIMEAARATTKSPRHHPGQPGCTQLFAGPGSSITLMLAAAELYPRKSRLLCTLTTATAPEHLQVCDRPWASPAS